VNSEELELSLRTEFESHLKNVVAGMRQEFSQFQEKIDAEFDKHKSQIDTVFQEFSARLETERGLEVGFTETVVEHLRLARDEGARISATAFAQAEEMEKQSSAVTNVAVAASPTAGISDLRDAINDITAQDSQATILKSLVNHAAQFTPRGAFFIVKNEHFVGWRAFGKEGDSDEQSVREIFFPVASSTALGESVRSLSAVESSFGTYPDDPIYLTKLGFGEPDRMYAIPLIARGRGVAVLYADYGSQGEKVNVEALETLVRVAGLTVEVLAAAPAAGFQDSQAVSQTYEESVSEERREVYTDTEVETSEDSRTVSDEQPEETEAFENEDFSAQPVSVSDSSVEEVDETEAISVQEEADAIEEVSVAGDEAHYWSQPTIVEKALDEPEVYQPVAAKDDYSAPVESDYQFVKPTDVEVSPETVETAQFEKPSFEPVGSFALEDNSLNGKAETPAVERFEPAVSEVVSAAPPVRSRFSDRNVDLPIEVGEDERRLHNDARRFARLLVSEIKLYNEQKVKEGRDAQDLYERLREAIDRSRDMYDKRVQPPVAAKFDYFHYELISSLAEGEEGKLGGNYPGAAI